MSRLKNITLLSIAIFISIFLFSCDEVIDEIPFREFRIPKGEHYSNRGIESLQSSSLAFQVIFDSTAIYKTQDPIQQFSTNKLLGFADCNSFHHENSARFGWQWLNGQLEILAYTYVNGAWIEKFIGTAEIGKVSNYQIYITEQTYIFTLDNFPPVVMDRGNTCNIGVYYMLYPYFGGQEVAPHDIIIKIRIQYD